MSFFINILGSNTLYYNLVAKAVKTYHSHDKEDDSIATIIKKILYVKESYFFQRFIKRIDSIKFNFKDHVCVIGILLALSKGYLRKKELASLDICDSKELNSCLQKMVDLNYIESLGNIYKLKDPLFSFWLKLVFDLQFSLPILNGKRKDSLFESQLHEEMCLLKEEFFKDKLKKILQLFSSFKNDTLRLGKNRYSLPLVVNAKVISYPNRDFHLLVGEGREVIFAGIKESNVEDNDIFDFIEKGSNIKGKRVKKIFISLDDLPPTARVIAKNNKFIIWDVNDVNRLLNIYNVPLVSCNL